MPEPYGIAVLGPPQTVAPGTAAERGTAALRAELRRDGTLRAELGDPVVLPAVDAEAVREHAAVLRSASVVHVHGGHDLARAVCDVVGGSVPVVLTVRDGVGDTTSPLPGELRAVVTTTEAAAARVRERSAHLAGRVVVLPDPVETAGLTRGRRAPQTLDRWTALVATADRTTLRTLRAFASFAADRPRASLLLVGADADDPAVRAEVTRLGLTGRVTALPGEDLRTGAAVLDRDLLVQLGGGDVEEPVQALARGLPVVTVVTDASRHALDVAQEQWTAWLVHDQDEVQDVVDAVARLESRLGSAAPDVVRADLEHRFAPASFARQLAGVLRSGRLPSGDRFRVVGVALHADADRRARRQVTDAVRYGGAGVLVTDRPQAHRDLDPRIVLVDVSQLVRMLPTRVVETVVLDLVPRTVLRATAPVARTLGRVETHARVARVHRRLARRVRNRVTDRLVHSHVEPIAVARYVLARHADEVLGADLVLWNDFRGIPLAARIAQAAPDAQVLRGADNAVIAALGAPAPAEPEH